MRNALQFIHNTTLNLNISNSEALQLIHIRCDDVLGHKITPLRSTSPRMQHAAGCACVWCVPPVIFSDAETKEAFEAFKLLPGLLVQEVGRCVRPDTLKQLEGLLALAEAVCKAARAPVTVHSGFNLVPLQDIANLSTFVDTIKLARGL